MSLLLTIDLSKAKYKDRLPGGLADKKKPSDFPKAALAAGIKVEMEHTSDKKLAREIAMDHLTEDLDYYKKLKKIEKGKKPYGHVAYTRRTKTGKLVQVQARGVKPQEERAAKPAKKKTAVALGTRKKKRATTKKKAVNKWQEWSNDLADLMFERWERNIERAFAGSYPQAKSKQAKRELAWRWFSTGVVPGAKPSFNTVSDTWRFLAQHGDLLVTRGIYPKNPSTGRQITSKGGFKTALKKAVEKEVVEVKKRTGFEISHPGTSMKTSKEENIFGIVQAIEGLEKVFNVKPEDHGCPVVVRSLYNGANATYNGWENKITIDTAKGKHSFFHEFGHLLDFKQLIGRNIDSSLGSADIAVRHYIELTELYNEKLEDYEAGEIEESELEYVEKQAEAAEAKVDEFGELAHWCYALRNETDYYEKLRDNPSQRRRNYLGEPTEVFARYFDQWVWTRMKEKGLDPASYNVRSPHQVTSEIGWAFTDEQFNHMRVYFEDMVGEKLLKAILGIYLEKGLLTENPHRKKEYAHITHTHGGKRIRARQHKADSDYTLEDWLSDTRSKLTEYAEESMEEGHDSIEQWLRDRGLRLPDADDAVTRRTANDWLCNYGHTVFALGMHIADTSGKTIASPEELPKVEKGLVINDDLLMKAGRLRGAKGKERLKRTKYGAIEFLDTGKIRYLEKKDLGKENAIVARYSKRGKAVRHHPGTFYNVESETLAALKQRRAPKPIENASNFEDVAAQLEEQRGEEGAAISMVEVLKERVASWTPPKKYRAAIDPIFKKEFDQLVIQKRKLARKLKGGRRGSRAMAALSVEYRELITRINQIRSKAYAVEGGGKVKIGTRSFQFMNHGVVDEEGRDVPYRDLGFEPHEKPMSYLLSVTEWPRIKEGKRKGELKLETNEYDALRWEYSRLVRTTVGQIANSYNLYDIVEKNGQEVRRLNSEGQDLLQDAWIKLFNLAHEWDPKKHGAPSPSNNFARYVYGLFPDKVKNEFAKERKEQGKEVSAEDLESMPERAGGKKLTPGARIESPEAALRRQGLKKWVSRIFGNVMPDPLQVAVVESRLNILNHQQTGVKDDVLQWPARVKKQGLSYKEPRKRKGRDPTPLAAEMVVKEKAGFGMKPWKAVKDDVLAALDAMPFSPEERKNRRKLITALAPSQLNLLYFKPAMDKLRSSSHGLSFEERKVLSDFASLHAKYLEGVRHESFDPSEAISKLVVAAPAPLKEGELKKLEAKYDALTEKLKKTKVGTKTQEKLLEKKREVGRQLLDARGRAKYHAPTKGKRSTEIERHHAGAAGWWSRKGKENEDIRGLAKLLDIDLSYKDYRKIPNTTMPPNMERDRLKSEAYYHLLQEMKGKTLASLRASLGKAEIPDTIKVGKTRVKANIPRDHYDAMLRFWIRRKGSRVSKSIMIPDCVAAVDALIEECLVWDLNEA